MKPVNVRWNKDNKPDGGISYGEGYTISWQRGPLTNGRNGAFLLEVLESCKFQLEYFETTEFACDENKDALAHLNLAIESLQNRANKRQQENKLGTHKV